MDDPSKRLSSTSQPGSPVAGHADRASPLKWAGGRTNPWLVCLLPFAVFMLVGSLEPAPPEAASPNPTSTTNQAATPAETHDSGWSIPYNAYPLIYTLKIALTLAAMLYVLPGYRQFERLGGRWRVSPLAVGVGVLGVVIWVVLASAQRWLVHHELGWNMALGARSAFNPLGQFAARPAQAYAFLAIRFLGLAALVPVFEEFFLRGFVMRFVVATEWWNVPFGRVNRLALVLGTAVPVFLHPGEAIAAAVWFSGVTWLMLRTKNIWDCILAHAITNLLLGIYVVSSGQWWLL